MKKFTKFLAIILIAVLAIGVVPAPAEAKAAKKVTAGVTPEKAGKLASGKNVVSCKKDNAYFCFKAPAAAKYTFTFSDLATIGDNKKTGLGSLLVKEKIACGKRGMYVGKEVSTEGGKSNSLRLASKNYNSKSLGGKGTKQYRKTRTAKNVALKKGETIWFQFIYSAHTGKMNVNVEKVKPKKKK